MTRDGFIIVEKTEVEDDTEYGRAVGSQKGSFLVFWDLGTTDKVQKKLSKDSGSKKLAIVKVQVTTISEVFVEA